MILERSGLNVGKKTWDLKKDQRFVYEPNKGGSHVPKKERYINKEQKKVGRILCVSGIAELVVAEVQQWEEVVS